MSFISLLLKNLVRQRVRTGLTVLGICVGITTVVALGVITSGLKDMAGDILRAGNADFMVAQKGSADLAFSAVSEADQTALAEVEGVAEATGVLIHVTRVGSNPYFFMMGVAPEQLSFANLQIVEGHTLEQGDTGKILLGAGAAGTLNLAIGDDVTIDQTAFTVAGIYRTGDTLQDGGAFMPLSDLQAVTGRTGTVTMVYIAASEGYSVEDVSGRINDTFSNLISVTTVEEYGQVDQGMEMMDAVNIAISVLAVGIGAIGVMNTMIMSVFERTREIGILKAVGWRNRKVLELIVGESMVLCFVAAIAGIICGILLSRAVMLIPAVGHLLSPSYTPDVFIRALLVAVVVALVGAAYPAFRATRMTPMEALRHE
jgi:putative ABC transport system permease protein